MPKNKLTIIYWNIWLELQNGKRDDGAQLIQRFNELVSSHNPDFFGLNEVVIHTKTGKSTVIDFFKNQGYGVHFVPFSNISTDLVVGSALAYKIKPKAIRSYELGPDTQALRRGFPNQSVSLIHGDFLVGGTPITIIVNYLGNLIPLDWGTHVTHRKNFNQYLARLDQQNIVIGGDFNEPKYLWTWRKLPQHFTRHTGTIINPTWKLLGKNYAPLQANYDYVLHTTKNALRLKKFEVLNRYPSDHSPLLAVFNIKKP